MKLKPLSNIDIERALVGSKYFGGVFSKDYLRFQDPKAKKYYILNMESSRQNDRQGSHWILVSNVDPKYAFYFDSLGVYEPPKNVAKWMRRTRKRWLLNSTQYQGVDSIVCGYWCIYVGELIDQGKTPFQIDRILQKFIPNHMEWKE